MLPDVSTTKVMSLAMTASRSAAMRGDALRKNVPSWPEGRKVEQRKTQAARGRGDEEFEVAVGQGVASLIAHRRPAAAGRVTSHRVRRAMDAGQRLR